MPGNAISSDSFREGRFGVKDEGGRRVPITAVGSNDCCNRIQEGQAVLELGGGYIEKSAAFVNGDNGKVLAAESMAREGSKVQS